MKNFNLTPRAQKLIKDAVKLAKSHNHSYINSVHFFAALIAGENQITSSFAKYKINLQIIKDASDLFLSKLETEKNTKDSGYVPLLNNATKDVMKYAKQLSNKHDHKYIGLEHLFLSLFEVGENLFCNFCDFCKISNLSHIENVIAEVEESLNDNPSKNKTSIEQPLKSNIAETAQKSRKFLSQFATCLNDQVTNGKINNIHPNELLIQKISEILCRRNKNNPLIIGEAGVGKTALVESLAQYIVEGKCSDFLALKQIYMLDVPSIVAGSRYRGDFEEKIKNLIKEVIQDEQIVLFIDEIHTIIGAGNSENGMDVANILKPYLARGDISCIGATTFDEYKKKIANDPAFNRRFQIIKIEEPNKQQTFELLSQIRNGYETYHCSEFSDEILKFAIEMADKHIEGRFPDKVIDLIDQTGSSIKLNLFRKTPKRLKSEEQIKKLSIKYAQKPNASLQSKIEKIVSKYHQHTIDLIEKLKKKKYQVTKHDILNAIANRTNIPIEELRKEDFEKLKNTKQKLQEQIVGQDEQINQIHKCLLRSKAGFRNEQKPLATFLFAGATGSGKTLTAKIMAENMFQNKNCFITIDMSEYSDKTAVNKLTGSNPGYIGFDKGGVLTEKINRNPYSLILFDEIQKADPDIIGLLFQILEEGRLSDSSGKRVDFSNTVIVMTTNLGSEEIFAPRIGFGSREEKSKNVIFQSLKKHFPADFLNRIDEIIPFNPLSKEDIDKIINQSLIKLKTDLKFRNIDFKYSSDLILYVSSKIQFDNFGARQVSKTISREIETLIAEKILENPSAKEIEIMVSNNELTCNVSI